MVSIYGLNEIESKNFNVSTFPPKDRVYSFLQIFLDACDHKKIKNTCEGPHFSKHDCPTDSPVVREKGLSSPNGLSPSNPGHQYQIDHAGS